MSDLVIALAQLNTAVGDLAGNAEKVSRTLAQAERQGADLCVFPELTITGYPPEDLLLKPGFVRDNQLALSQVAAATDRCAAVIGFVELLAGTETKSEQGEDGSDQARPAVPETFRPPLFLANAAALCCQGSVVGIYRKRRLPNYAVFDEQRWFLPGSGRYLLYQVGGMTIGLSICEDIWFRDGPVVDQARAGAELIININASPYSIGLRSQRLDLLRERARQAGVPLVYVNQVGGQDELVFDGASMVVDQDGNLLAAGLQFEEDLVLVPLPVPSAGGQRAPDSRARHLRGTTAEVLPVAWPPRNRSSQLTVARPSPPVPLEEDAEMYQALVIGTRDYLAKNGFHEAVIGLSGGIDSSLVATIAVDALGAEHVHGLSMPSRYSSVGSRTDAQDLARILNIDLHTVSIEEAHTTMSSLLRDVLGDTPSGLADENMQSRLRGVLLMAVSNDRGWIVLTTGNKSEMATGYSTLYGDSAGGFAVIKDVAKTRVYRLCRFRNRRALADGQVSPIPQSVLTKAPSAELRPDQRDDQSLPPYEILDPVLEAYVEGDRTAADLVASGFAPEVVEQVVRLVDGAEYKRRQMPPGVRITMKAFGKDRRMPITNGYLAFGPSPGETMVAPLASREGDTSSEPVGSPGLSS